MLDLVDRKRLKEAIAADRQHLFSFDSSLHDLFMTDIDEIPTIDPETLPIVQELREQLARVTAERDAAVKDLYAVKACKTCALQFSDDCLLEECFEPCGATLSENTPYKWRGIQEAQDNE